MAYAGHGGSVTITNLQTDVTAWSIEENCLAIDTSVLGTQYRDFIAGPLDWNGTMSMLYHSGNTLSVGATFNGVWTMASGETKAGLAILTQLAPAVEFEGVVVQPATFQGKKKLT